jgi:hypothetical protein
MTGSAVSGDSTIEIFHFLSLVVVIIYHLVSCKLSHNDWSSSNEVEYIPTSFRARVRVTVAHPIINTDSYIKFLS